jgi:hypothetical protein
MHQAAGIRDDNWKIVQNLSLPLFDFREPSLWRSVLLKAAQIRREVHQVDA